MADFTQGPWISIDRTVYALNDESINRFNCLVDPGWVNNDERTSYDECRANARLIAAAPEMYEALQECIDAIQAGPLEIAAKYGPDAHPDEWIVDAAHRARRVLGKIESKS